MTTVTLTGVDGSVWDLLDRTAPVSLANGLGGLHLPTVTHQWTTAAGRSGRRWRGSRMESREFTVRVLVGDTVPPYRRGEDWRTLDRQWWQALSTEARATLTVGGRSLRFRLDGDQGAPFQEKDPSLLGKAVYDVDCVADRPEWRGTPVTASFVFDATTAKNFYGDTAGVGPPFYISPAGVFSTASISNPGDLPSHALWTISGPAPSVTFGIAGHTTTLPFSLAAGQTVIVDTGAQTITDTQGNSLWPQMGYTPVDLTAVPPGDPSPLLISMDGAQAGASVMVSLTPLYRRAW